MQQLTSPHNPLLKSIRHALASGVLTEDGFLVAEGPHLLAEAIRSRIPIHIAVCTAAGLARYASHLQAAGCEIVQVPAKVFTQISSTNKAQEVLALVRPPAFEWNALLAGVSLVVALDAVQDPGNAGAIVRSAEAFGASGLVLLQGSVRVANPKFLRATAGSVFRLPLLESLDPQQLIHLSRRSGLALYTLASRARQTIREADLRRSCVLVVGNEGAGVNPALLAASTPVAIPTGAVESLNAAVASAVALYEAHNQRNA